MIQLHEKSSSARLRDHIRLLDPEKPIQVSLDKVHLKLSVTEFLALPDTLIRPLLRKNTPSERLAILKTIKKGSCVSLAHPAQILVDMMHPLVPCSPNVRMWHVFLVERVHLSVPSSIDLPVGYARSEVRQKVLCQMERWCSILGIIQPFPHDVVEEVTSLMAIDEESDWDSRCKALDHSIYSIYAHHPEIHDNEQYLEMWKNPRRYKSPKIPFKPRVRHNHSFITPTVFLTFEWSLETTRGRAVSS